MLYENVQAKKDLLQKPAGGKRKREKSKDVIVRPSGSSTVDGLRNSSDGGNVDSVLLLGPDFSRDADSVLGAFRDGVELMEAYSEGFVPTGTFRRAHVGRKDENSSSNNNNSKNNSNSNNKNSSMNNNKKKNSKNNNNKNSSNNKNKVSKMG